MKPPSMRLPTTKTSVELIKEHLGTRGTLDASDTTSPALEMLEFYTTESSQQLLLVYGTAPMAAGDWLRIDDLEFSVDEHLSQDEVAKCIFVLSGGDLYETAGIGETANYLVYYSEELKGTLGLSPKIKAAGSDFYHIYDVSPISGHF